MFRESFLEINVDRYQANIAYLKGLNDKNLIAVIKANGYGIIDYIAAKLAKDAGVSFFAVSSLSEALSLRDHDINDENILILGYVPNEYLKLVKKRNLSIASVSKDYIYGIDKEVLKGLKVHLKIDTGMNRIGLFKDEVKEVLEYLLANGALVEGIFTHYACSDEADDIFTLRQYNLFKEVLNSLDYKFKYIHTSNTDATVHFKDEVSNYVRCGLGLVGMSSYHTDLKPCIALYTTIINTKTIKEDGAISYGQHYKLNQGDYISTLPIGYADGVIRKNRGRKVYVEDEYAEIVGSICMDQMMIKTKRPHSVRTSVEIFGEHCSIFEMAKDLDTIVYEILTNLSDRLTRVYVNDKHEVVGIYTPRFNENELDD